MPFAKAVPSFSNGNCLPGFSLFAPGVYAGIAGGGAVGAGSDCADKTMPGNKNSKMSLIFIFCV
jgi:hypothetical protein